MIIRNLSVVVSNDVKEIKDLVAQGYCPVECSIEGDSIVDDLVMDHHGKYSHLGPVSTRSYLEHYGARKDDPRFVIAECVDADAAFTVAALAGLLPHPEREVPSFLPPPVRAARTRDVRDIATTIGQVDLSPIGLTICDLPGGDFLQLWNAQMDMQNRDELGGLAAVILWRNLLDANPATLSPYLAAGRDSEKNRKLEALKDLGERGEFIDGVLVLKESRVWGFDDWYQRVPGLPFTAVDGWKAPIVLAWAAQAHNITVGCPCIEVAESLFGKGGLKNIFPALAPEGWGGREAVGGSPRGVKMSWEQVTEAARKVAAVVKSATVR